MAKYQVKVKTVRATLMAERKALLERGVSLEGLADPQTLRTKEELYNAIGEARERLSN